MKYQLDIIANNFTYQSGDSLLISFNKPFLYVQSIDSVVFDFLPLDTLQDGHDIDIRWSYDINEISLASGNPQVVWSAWESFSKNTVINSNIQLIFAKILSEYNSIDIQFRLVRRGIDGIPRKINKVTLELTHANPPETALSADFPTNDDGCKAISCVTQNFCSGVTLKCDTGSLFRPYDVMGPGIQLWQDLSCAVSEMFGHCVRYFKTSSRVESADAVLKEYSLFEVTDVKDVKLLLPDNQIPDNAVAFMAFDMDFSEGLEVHIVKEHFERAFGINVPPEQKDYLYFPLIDRIYEVHSAYLFKDFMAAEAYYKVMLYKWQDKLNVMREDQSIAEYVDAITDDFDEVLQPEIEKEYIDITKPLQYTTVSIGGQDKVRSHINQNLSIEIKDITNYFTVIGKYFYDLRKDMNWGDLAVNYKLRVDRKIEQNTAFSSWFRTKKTTFDKSPETFDIILEGYSDQTNIGYRFSLEYESGTIAGSAVTSSIKAIINQQEFIFPIGQLDVGEWYGLVINHLNEFSQISLHLWEMKYNPNQPTQNKTTDLRLIYTNNFNLIPESVNSEGTFQLRAGNLAITNIRVWDQSIEEEKQAKILNQYVIRESRHALLIDNAISPLRLVKEYVR